MYKKAGVVIALLLVVAGIVVMSISSCQENGGVHVEPTQTEVSWQDNDYVPSGGLHPENYSSEVSFESKESSGVQQQPQQSQVQVETSNRLTPAEQSQLEEYKRMKAEEERKKKANEEEQRKAEEQSRLAEQSRLIEESKAEQSRLVEESKFAEQSRQIEESKAVDSNGTSGDTNNSMLKEVIEVNLPTDKRDEEVDGEVKGKHIYQLNDIIFSAIIILDNKGNSYDYFVPQATYNSIAVGTKLKVSVRYYLVDGQIKKQQVLGVSLADG